jgi:multidrug transporter EmrE-like cation transporter
MTDIYKLIIGIILGIFAQIISFFQLQGSSKFLFLKDNYLILILLGIPISTLFIFSVKNLIGAFDGQLWPSRLIGFSIGAIVFTILSWLVFSEPLSTKTIICLFLAFLILIIQLLPN